MGSGAYMKAYNLYSSIFVGFCVGSFLTALLSVLLRPIIPDETSLPMLGALFLIIWSCLVCFLGGVGFGEKNNRLGMLLAGIVGWLFLGAGFVGFGYQIVSPLLSFDLGLILFYVGYLQAHKQWVQRLLIIKKDESSIKPETREDAEELGNSYEN
ncbi:MAG: hypothetical protein EAX95_01600 [Candidatus Thorarchaeota archaeon]|nr:hypothetical protein [Candidatus Thorarchaeota archaeon]